MTAQPKAMLIVQEDEGHWRAEYLGVSWAPQSGWHFARVHAKKRNATRRLRHLLTNLLCWKHGLELHPERTTSIGKWQHPPEGDSGAQQFGESSCLDCPRLARLWFDKNANVILGRELAQNVLVLDWAECSRILIVESRKPAAASSQEESHKWGQPKLDGRRHLQGPVTTLDTFLSRGIFDRSAFPQDIEKYAEAQWPTPGKAVLEIDAELGGSEDKSDKARAWRYSLLSLRTIFVANAQRIVDALLAYRIGTQEGFTYFEKRNFHISHLGYRRISPSATTDSTITEDTMLSLQYFADSTCSGVRQESRWTLLRTSPINNITDFVLRNPQAVRMFVLAAPGGLGKSSFLLWLAKKILKKHNDISSPFYQKIPIYIPCAHLTDNWQTNIAAFLCRKAQLREEEYGMPREGRIPYPFFPPSMDTRQIEQFLADNSEHLVLLLDGYNERHSLDFADSFASFPANVKIVATREEDAKDFCRFSDSDLVVIQLAELDRADVDDFIKQCGRNRNSNLQQYRSWFQNPLLLRLYLQGASRRSAFRTQFAFFENICATLMERENRKWRSIIRAIPAERRPSIALVDLFNILPSISLSALKDGYTRIIPGENFRNYCLALPLIDKFGATWRDIHASVLFYNCIFGAYSFEGGDFEYYHQSFQEYFCAVRMARLIQTSTAQSIVTLCRNQRVKGIWPWVGGALDSQALNQLSRTIVVLLRKKRYHQPILNVLGPLFSGADTSGIDLRELYPVLAALMRQYGFSSRNDARAMVAHVYDAAYTLPSSEEMRRVIQELCSHYERALAILLKNEGLNYVTLLATIGGISFARLLRHYRVRPRFIAEVLSEGIEKVKQIDPHGFGKVLTYIAELAEPNYGERRGLIVSSRFLEDSCLKDYERRRASERGPLHARKREPPMA